MSKEIELESPKFEFAIQCGDWIYPSKDSRSIVRYPTPIPLTAIIYPAVEVPDDFVPYLGGSKTNCHLSAARTLHVRCNKINGQWLMRLIKLTNSAEPMFEYGLSVEIPFTLDNTLPRFNEYWRNLRNGYMDDVNWAVFFTDVLFMNYINQVPKHAGFFTDVLFMNYINQVPKHAGRVDLDTGLFIRESTIVEIESIGCWSRR